MIEPTTQPREQHETPWGIIRRLGPASVLAMGAAVLPPIGSVVLFLHIDEAGRWLRERGMQGIAIYAGAFALLAGIAVLPTYASAILGGWAFGFERGFPAALAGFLAGAALAYAVARPTAAERVERVVNEHTKWRAVRDALLRHGPWRTLAMVTLLRLPPNSPFAMTNLVLASARVPLWIYLLGTLIGMAPRTGIVLALAASLRNQLASEAARARPWWLLVAGLVAAIIVLAIIGVIAKSALTKMTTVGNLGVSEPRSGT